MQNLILDFYYRKHDFIRITRGQMRDVSEGRMIPIADRFCTADIGKYFCLQSDNEYGFFELQARIGDYCYFR